MSKYRSERRIAEAAGLLKALGQPHRLRIYLRLLQCCGGRTCRGTEEEVARCVGDLGHNLGVSPSTLSHHLKELRGAGLIRMERNGQRVECGIDPTALRGLRELLEELTAAEAAESGACS